MADPRLSEVLASYVPTPVARRIASDPRQTEVPRTRRYQAVMLFADITGFTPLTERIGQQGSAGVEKLSDLLNAYFGGLLATIDEHGGDVTGFAGDALLAIWPADESDTFEAVQSVASCGLELQRRLHDHDTGDGVRLSLRVGVGVGEVIEMEVGGTRGRWQYLLAGSPIVQVAIAEGSGAPGEIVLSPEAAASLGSAAEGTVLPNGCLVLRTLRDPPTPRAAAPIALDPSAADALRNYVSEAVLARLDAGQTDWLEELRRVTVAFVGLRGVEYGSSEGVERIHTAVRELQATVDRFEGSLLRVAVDDKGTALLVGFGVPPNSHEDDSVRALQAAMAMSAVLRAHGIFPAVGIATGRAFCGAIGGTARREYTVIGDVANLAARLMQAADNEVLCDEATNRGARGQIAFEALPALTVKGKPRPVPVFRPLGRAGGEASRDGSAIVGRLEERAALALALDGLLADGAEGARGVVLQAEAGLGKSRLIEDLLGRAGPLAEQGRLCVLVGTAEAVEQATAYYPWRKIVHDLLGLESGMDVSAQRARALAELATLPELGRFAPVLNGVLPLEIPENEVTERMSGDVRAHNTRAVVVGLLRRMALSAPVLLVIEDAHWYDSASWALLRAAIAAVGPLLTVIAMRPPGEPVPSEYHAILDAPATRLLVLGAMSTDEALAIVRARLGVASLPDQVAALIAGKAQGNPFFSEELAYALRDAGLIEVAGGECRLAPDAGDLSALDFPDTVQGVIISRIDHLLPQQQLTLKVASVIGRAFASRIVRDVYPIEAERQQLAGLLLSLGQLDLTPMETPPPEDTYIFKHVVTQEVAYNLMLFAQRRELHRRAAEWYEEAHASNLEPYYPVLAHHWGRAEIVPRTIEYLDKAGGQALRQGTYGEAIGFLTAALDLDAHAEVVGDRVRRARWEAALGEAHHGLTHLPEARLHYERSLMLLGEPVPQARGGWAVLLAKSLARQVAHLALPGALARWRRPQPHLEQLADTCARLAFVYYHQNDRLTSIATSIRGLNVAEIGGSERLMARLYGNMCVAASFVPIHWLAERYGRFGSVTASAAGDLPTLAFSNTTRAWVHVGLGKWDAARQEIDTAVDIYRHIGELRLLDESMMVQAVSRRTGALAPLAGMWDAVYESARRRGDAEVQSWSLANGSVSLLARDRLDEAFDRLRRAESLLSSHSSRTGFIKAYGPLGLAHLRADEPELAARAADTAYRSIADATPILVSTFDGYAGCAETYLILWGQGDERYRHLAWQALRKLEGLARVFPICRPRAWLYRGIAENAEGKSARARSAWERSLALAAQFAMPYEGARAHYEIASHLPKGDATRTHHLDEAGRVFEQVGAEYELRLTRTAR